MNNIDNFFTNFCDNFVHKKGAEMENLQVASSLPVAIASPLGWNFTLLMSDVWPWCWCNSDLISVIFFSTNVFLGSIFVVVLYLLMSEVWPWCLIVLLLFLDIIITGPGVGVIVIS